MTLHRETRLRWMIGLVGMVLATVWTSPRLQAGEMAQILPAETVFYLEWAGADATAEARKQSALGRLAAEPEVRQFCDQVRTAAVGFLPMAATLSGAGAILEPAQSILSTFWHRPWALDLLGVEPTQVGCGPRLILAVDVGDAGSEFLGHVKTLLAAAPGIPASREETIDGTTTTRIDHPFLPPVRYGLSGGLFLFTVGEKLPARVLAVSAGKEPALASNESLQAARKKLGGYGRTPLLFAHLDVGAGLAATRTAVLAFTGREELPPMAQTLLRETGVNDVRSISYELQIADGGFRGALYLAVPTTAPGLGALISAPPLTDDDLVLIPKDATFAKATNFDLARAFDEGLRIVQALGPEATENVNQAFEQFRKWARMDLRQDVIAPFDDGWVVYNAPSSGGLLITGVTFIVEAKDPAAVEKLLANTVRAIARSAHFQGVMIKSYDHRDHKISYVGFVGVPIPVAPAWTTHKNRVVIALYPQMVAQVIDRITAPDAKDLSILANPDFVRGRKLLPADCSTLVYSDTAQAVEGLHKLLLPAWTAGAAMVQKFGITLDAALLPRGDVVSRYMFGHVAGVSHDAEGMLVVSHGPLPIMVPAIGEGGTFTTAMAVSVLLPSLARARELAKQQQAEQQDTIHQRLTSAIVGSDGVIARALDKYKADVGSYPTSQQGLAALYSTPDGVDESSWQGPYLDGPLDELVDPWCNSFHYRCPGEFNKDAYDLWSSGPDGQSGTDDDTTNWETK